MTKVFTFLRDVRIELAKVTWPSAKQTSIYTLVVLSMSIVVALFLALWDLVFQSILQNVI